MTAAERAELEDRLGQLLRQGEQQEAVVLAVRGFGPELLGYLHALLADDDEARDVFAQTSEKIWKNIGQFRMECPLRNWAYRLAWSTAQDHLKARRRRRERRLRTSEISHIAAEVRAETPAFRRTATRDRLAEARAQLAPEEQTLLILRLDRELSWDEVAAIMGETAATLRKRYERLRERLGKLLGV